MVGRAPGRPLALVPAGRQPPLAARRAGRGPDAAARPGPGPALGRARCRSCSRCSPRTSRCRCRPTPAWSRPRPGSPGRTRPGIPRDAADRNYRDANHKPELICALTEFHALVGFREPGGHACGCCARWTCPSWPATPSCWPPSPNAGRPARAVHHLDHAAAGGAGHAGAGAAGRLRAAGRRSRRASSSAEARTVAGAVRALPRRRGGAGRAAAQPGHPGARGGAVPAGRQPARLPVRGRRRADGQLGQRAARRADPQARGRPGAAAGAGLRRAPPPVLTGRPDGAWVRYDTPAEEFLLRRWDGPTPAPGTRSDGAGRPRRGARRRPADPAVHRRLGAACARSATGS